MFESYFRIRGNNTGGEQGDEGGERRGLDGIRSSTGNGGDWTIGRGSSSSSPPAVTVVAALMAYEVDDEESEFVRLKGFCGC